MKQRLIIGIAIVALIFVAAWQLWSPPSEKKQTNSIVHATTQAPATSGNTEKSKQLAAASLLTLDTAPEVQSLSADRGIRVDDAKRRIEWQARAGALSEMAAEQFGKSFGGVWIDTDNGDRVQLALVNASARETSAAHDLIASQGLLDGADVVSVRYSQPTLLAANEWLANEVGKLNSRDTVPLETKTDARHNQVQLTLPYSPLTSAQQNLVAAARERYGAMLKIEYGETTNVTTSCNFTKCDDPLRGGTDLKRQDGAGCTGAFEAVRLSDFHEPYLITAGHCGKDIGEEWRGYRSNGKSYRIGTLVERVHNTGGDFALIRLDVNIPLNNWVLVLDSPNSNYNEQYPIRATGASVEGMRICYTGATTGTHCGTVTGLNVTGYSVNTDVTVNNLGETDICGIDFGDSGGPFYARNTAYGILSMMSKSGCKGKYQGIRHVEKKFGIAVLTG